MWRFVEEDVLTIVDPSENSAPSYDSDAVHRTSLNATSNACMESKIMSLPLQRANEFPPASSPENSWKGFRLIDADSSSISENGLDQRLQLSPEAELEL